jgi:uncharacterized OB-fold protein
MEIPKHWRLKKQRLGSGTGQLVGSQCPEGHINFPPRPDEFCPQCHTILEFLNALGIQAQTVYQSSDHSSHLPK